MKNVCRGVELGVAAQWWFERWMYMYRLPAILLRHVDFNDGVFVTWLPRDVAVEEAQHFESGGRYRWAAEGCWPRDVLTDFVRQQLNSDRIWLFEDPVTRPHDEWIAKERILDILRSRGQVYYLIASDTAAQTVTTTIDTVLAAQPTVGMCVSLDRSRLQDEMSTESLAELIQGIHALTVGAYDGEGFIAWIRAPQVQSLLN